MVRRSSRTKYSQVKRTGRMIHPRNGMRKPPGGRFTYHIQDATPKLMPAFELGRDVHENVGRLRVALGSIAKALSFAELGRVITERHPKGRSVSPSQVQRWETDVQPDLESIEIMAQLAGVTFEEFALGTREKARTAPASAFKRASSQEEEAKRRPARKKGA